MNLQYEDFSNVLNDHNALVEDNRSYEEKQIQALQNVLDGAKSLEDIFKITSFGNYKGAIHVLSKEFLGDDSLSKNYRSAANLKTLTGFSYEDKVRVAVYCFAIVASVFSELQDAIKVNVDELIQRINKSKNKRMLLKLGEVNNPKKSCFSYSVVSDFLNGYQLNSGVSFKYAASSDFLYKMFSDGTLTITDVGTYPNDSYVVKFNSNSCDFSFVASDLKQVGSIFNALTLEVIRNYSIKSLKNDLMNFLNKYSFSFCGLNAEDIFKNYFKRELNLFDDLDESERVQLKRKLVDSIIDDFSKKIYSEPYKVKFNDEFNVDEKVDFIIDFNFNSKNIKKADKEKGNSSLNSKGESANVLYYIAQQLKGADFNHFDKDNEIEQSGYVKKFNVNWKLKLKPVIDSVSIKKIEDECEKIKDEIDSRFVNLKFLYGPDVPTKKFNNSDVEIVDVNPIAEEVRDSLNKVKQNDFDTDSNHSGHFFNDTLQQFKLFKQKYETFVEEINSRYDKDVEDLNQQYSTTEKTIIKKDPETGVKKEVKINQSSSLKKKISALDTKKKTALRNLEIKYDEGIEKLKSEASKSAEVVLALASAVVSAQKKLIRAEDSIKDFGIESFSEDVCKEWKDSFISLMSAEDNVVQGKVPEPKRETDKTYSMNGKLSFNLDNKEYFYTMSLLIVER